MAIHYYLLIDTNLTPFEVSDIIFELEGLKKNDRENTFFVDWLIGGVSEESESDKRLNQEEFGLSPTISIWFDPRCDDDEEQEKAMKDMMRVIVHILQKDSGDAVLVIDGEYLVLSRIKGNLLLDSDNFGEKDRWWNPQVDVPFKNYEVKDLN